MSIAREGQASHMGISRLMENFRQHWCWVLLPLLFAICFIVPNRTGATNLYRLFIVLPMLLCFRPADMKDIWANTPARWFLLLCSWMTLTLFWDGWSDKDVNLLLRELNVLALFYLVYLVGKYQSNRLPGIVDSLLFFGFIGALLIISDWKGILNVDANWQHKESARGIFNHHLEVGWIMAVLTIIALHSWLKSVTFLTNFIYFAALIFFAGLTFLVQARGGYLILLSGAVLLLVLNPGKKAASLLGISAVVVPLVGFSLDQELLVILDKLVDRGAAGRFVIWQNGYEAITSNSASLLFGHGLSADASNMIGNFRAVHYHNFYLNQVFYGGLFGLALYLGFFCSIIIKVIQKTGIRVWGVVFIAMQIGFMTDGDRLIVNPTAMLLTILLAAAMICFDVGFKGREAKG